MQLLLGVALLTFVLATSVVGVRLLALGRRSRQLPEALIGAGFMGATHAECYAALGAEVAVVCGLEEDRVRVLAERLGAQATSDWQEAVAMPGVDAVDLLADD